MSELFSDRRLIDYFIMFDVDVYDPIIPEEGEKQQQEEYTIQVNYKYKTLKKFPKKNYHPTNFYHFEADAIYDMLPFEELYLKKMPNKFFAKIYTNIQGIHYYGFFLKIFLEIESEHPIYGKLNLSSTDVKIYSPKYLSFFSMNPFFISFKNILEEIYNQSVLNNVKCIKIESILNCVLYRMHLPKYENTQIEWSLNDKVYTFSRNFFRSEISYKLLFTYISIDKIIFLYFAFLTNSKIFFFHSNIEILCPILHLFNQLLYPFSEYYSILNNLCLSLLDVLDSPTNNLIVGIYKKDFSDLDLLVNTLEGSNTSFIYFDIDENKIVLDKHEDMKKIDLLPKTRMNELMNKLCDIADIYQKDRTVLNEKKIDIWEDFQSENINLKNLTIKSQNTQKRAQSGFFSNLVQPSSRKNNLKLDGFSDNAIQALFSDLNLGLLEAYDESKHFEINEETQSIKFLSEKFIADSKPDIRNFLNYFTTQQCFDIFLQNMIHLVDQKHKKRKNINTSKIDLNSTIREAAIIADFHENYEFIIKGIERRREKKSLEKLSNKKIYNTISISSPKYENLPYIQTNLFKDPIHEDILIHESSINFNLLKIDFTNLNIELKDRNQFNNNLLNEEIMEMTNLQKNGLGSPRNNDLMSLIHHVNTQLNDKYPPTIEFKKYLIEDTELVKKFYGFKQTAVRNFISAMNKNKSIMDASTKDPFGQIKSFKKTFMSQFCQKTKEEYIKLLRDQIELNFKNTKPVAEFKFNFGVNVIQSVSFCDYCMKPNNLWDIRKELFLSNKKENLTKCKFCNQTFTPCYLVLTDPEDKVDLYSPRKRKKENRSFETEPNKNEPHLDNLLISNKNTIDKSKVVKKVEYMSLEQMFITYYEYENEENWAKPNTNKKFPFNLFFNVCLLLGEAVLRIEYNKVDVFLLDSYFKKYKGKIQDNKQSLNEKQDKPGAVKTLADMYAKNREEFNKKQEKEKNTKSKYNKFVKNTQSMNLNNKFKTIKTRKEKTVKIRFDIKDLINDDKYEELEKEIKKISNGNKIKVSSRIKPAQTLETYNKSKKILEKTNTKQSRHTILDVKLVDKDESKSRSRSRSKSNPHSKTRPNIKHIQKILNLNEDINIHTHDANYNETITNFTNFMLKSKDKFIAK